MVRGALAWNLKAWFGLLLPQRERGLELVRMEFRRFLQAIMLLPCQVVRTARRIIYRILGYNDWLVDFFATFERIPWAGPLSGPAHSAHNIGPRDRGREYSCVWPESRSAEPTEPITTPKRGKGVLKESCEGLQRGVGGRVSRMPVDWRQIPIPRRWFWG